VQSRTTLSPFSLMILVVGSERLVGDLRTVHGLGVRWAGTGEDALEALHSLQTHIVLVDLEASDLDRRLLRALVAHRGSIPIVAVSRSSPDQRFDAVLPDPLDYTALVCTLAALMERRPGCFAPRREEILVRAERARWTARKGLQVSRAAIRQAHTLVSRRRSLCATPVGSAAAGGGRPPVRLRPRLLG
jgi:DNA-binding response OmpR family regulator